MKWHSARLIPSLPFRTTQGPLHMRPRGQRRVGHTWGQIDHCTPRPRPLADPSQGSLIRPTGLRVILRVVAIVENSTPDSATLYPGYTDLVEVFAGANCGVVEVLVGNRSLRCSTFCIHAVVGRLRISPNKRIIAHHHSHDHP